MNYAYIDKYGILHISGDEKSANKYAKFNGNVLQTSIEASGGYPTFESRNGTENIVVYSMTDVKVNGEPVNPERFEKVMDIYRTLLMSRIR